MWFNPLPLTLVATSDSDSWRSLASGVTGLPIGDHVGAFGVERKNHIHEGVDLYAPRGTPVSAVEAGEVVAVFPFTGPLAQSPWWLDTECVLIEGPSGVVAYGEIEVSGRMVPGAQVYIGDHVGYVMRVLKEDKGRPTSMLHLELHQRGTRSCPPWYREQGRPATLLDPTPKLLPLCQIARPIVDDRYE
jgi:hypothetical protein